MAATKEKRGVRRSEKKNVKTTAAGNSKRPKRIKKKSPSLDGISQSSIIIKKNPDQKVKTKKKVSQGNRGVVYLSHIPHGFYEPQMKEYFAQFGAVRRLVLRRSNKTGKSRGYAFIEFYNEDVAKVAAETMNNYLMFERVLKCKFIPPEELKKKKKELFYNVNIANIKRVALDEKRQFNAPKSETKVSKLVKRKSTKTDHLSQILAERGIDFSFELPNVSSTNGTPSKVKEQTSPTAARKNSSAKSSGSAPSTDTNTTKVSLKTPSQKVNKREKKRRKKRKSKVTV